MSSIEHDGELTLDKDVAAGVLRLKAAASFGDPIELSADSARELARRLIELADELE
jgi:hypothetical protein